MMMKPKPQEEFFSLPLSPWEIKEGQKEKVSSSLRWLTDWCLFEGERQKFLSKKKKPWKT